MFIQANNTGIMIVLTPDEAKNLADDLDYSIGTREFPKSIGQELTNRMVELYLEEDK